MSLESGSKIHSNKWKELPIGDDVISRVHDLAKHENKKKVRDGNLRFEWAPGIPIEQVDEEEANADMNDENPGAANKNENENEQNALDIIPEENEEDVAAENGNLITDVSSSSEEDDESLDGSVHSIGDDENGDANNESNDFHENGEEAQGDSVSMEEDAPDGDNRMKFQMNEASLEADDARNDKRISPTEDGTNRSTDAIEVLQNEASIVQVLHGDGQIEEEEISNDGVRKYLAEDEMEDPPNVEAHDAGVDGGSNFAADGTRFSKRMKERREKSAIQHLSLDDNTVGGRYHNAVQMLMKIRKTEERRPEYGDFFRTVTNTIFAQMSATKGIREFGMRAVAAVIKELTQLDQGAVPGKPVVVPINPDVLTKEEI